MHPSSDRSRFAWKERAEVPDLSEVDDKIGSNLRNLAMLVVLASARPMRTTSLRPDAQANFITNSFVLFTRPGPICRKHGTA